MSDSFERIVAKLDCEAKLDQMRQQGVPEDKIRSAVCQEITSLIEHIRAEMVKSLCEHYQSRVAEELHDPVFLEQLNEAGDFAHELISEKADALKASFKLNLAVIRKDFNLFCES